MCFSLVDGKLYDPKNNLFTSTSLNSVEVKLHVPNKTERHGQRQGQRDRDEETETETETESGRDSETQRQTQ